jgi:hypothetical protein
MDTRYSSPCSQNLTICSHPEAGEFRPIRPTLYVVRSLYCGFPIYACVVQVFPRFFRFPKQTLAAFPFPPKCHTFSSFLIPTRTNFYFPFSVDIIQECLQLTAACVAVRRQCRRWKVTVLCLALSGCTAGVKLSHV